MSTAILYSNKDLTIFILDVPTSIANGQGGGRVVSVTPLEKPYLTPEPKAYKRLRFISLLAPEDVTYHQEIQSAISVAFKTIAPRDLWHLPRIISEKPIITHDLAYAETASLPVVLSPLPNRFSSITDVQRTIVSHGGECTTSLTIADTSYVVPSDCRFIWNTVDDSLQILNDLSVRPQFHIVLMDPPWPNRSVKKANKYTVMDRNECAALDDAFNIAQRFCSPCGYVTVWITNKHAIRTQVLECLTLQGFQLAEEWIWLKMTSQGEPVTILDGVWRKPYEILLVFHRGCASLKTRRRFIFAVPDVHSRKPNLKELFTKVFGLGLVLELFARNLTSGWWSIGDEVLKFQDYNSWHTIPD